MNKFIWEMAQKAKENPRKIAFPESLNSDILRTASQVVETGIGFVLLIGNQTEIEDLAGMSRTGYYWRRNTLGSTVISRKNRFCVRQRTRCGVPCFC